MRQATRRPPRRRSRLGCGHAPATEEAVEDPVVEPAGDPGPSADDLVFAPYPAPTARRLRPVGPSHREVAGPAADDAPDRPTPTADSRRAGRRRGRRGGPMPSSCAVAPEALRPLESTLTRSLKRALGRRAERGARSAPAGHQTSPRSTALDRLAR